MGEVIVRAPSTQELMPRKRGMPTTARSSRRGAGPHGTAGARAESRASDGICVGRRTRHPHPIVRRYTSLLQYERWRIPLSRGKMADSSATCYLAVRSCPHGRTGSGAGRGGAPDGAGHRPPGQRARERRRRAGRRRTAPTVPVRTSRKGEVHAWRPCPVNNPECPRIFLPGLPDRLRKSLDHRWIAH